MASKGSSLAAVRASAKAELGGEPSQNAPGMNGKAMSQEERDSFQRELEAILAAGGFDDDAVAETKQPDNPLARKLGAGKGKATSRVQALIAADAKEFGGKLAKTPGDAISIPGATAGGPVKRKEAEKAARAQTVANLDTSSEGTRRRLWSNRFASLGEAWAKKLRHCNWRQSLRFAFEVPALYSTAHAESGYHLNKPQFLAAVNYAIIRNPAVLTATEMDDIFSAAFDAFDVEGSGTVDYREFCAAFLFFRVPASTDAILLIETWFRQYDGDVHGGLTPEEFLRAMCTLATSVEEAFGILKLMNVKALVNAPQAIQARRDKLREQGLYVDPTSRLVRIEDEVEDAGDAAHGMAGTAGHGHGHGHGQTPSWDVEAQGNGGQGPVEARAYGNDGTVDDDFGTVSGSKRMVVDVRDVNGPGAGSTLVHSKLGIAGDIRVVPRSSHAEPVRGRMAGPADPSHRPKHPRLSPLQRTGSAGSAGRVDLASTGYTSGAGDGDGDGNGLRSTQRSSSPSRSPSRSMFKRDPLTEAAKDSFLGDNKPLPDIADDDPEAPWNRGSGTMTEVRVFYGRIKAHSKGIPTTSAIIANRPLAEEYRRSRADADPWEDAFGIEGMKPRASTRQASRQAMDAQLRERAARSPDRIKGHLDPYKNQRENYAAGVEKAAKMRELQAAIDEATGQRKRQLQAEMDELAARPISAASTRRGGRPSTADKGGLGGTEPPQAHLANDPLKRTGVFKRRSDEEDEDDWGQEQDEEQEEEQQVEVAVPARTGPHGPNRPKEEAPSTSIDSLPMLNRMLARALHPSRLPDGKITLQMIRHMVKKSPGMLAELHRLRLLRLPPVVRSAYLSWQLELQIKQAQQRFEHLREEVLSKRAMALWRAKEMGKWFHAWKSMARYTVWRRVKINSLRARRAVRRWYVHTRGQAMNAMGANAATTHYMIVLLKKVFNAWKLFKGIKKAKGELGDARALAYRRQLLLSNSFDALRDSMYEGRAVRHFGAWVAKHTFRAWVRYVNMNKEDRAKAEIAARVLEERLKATAAFLDSEEKAKLEAAKAEAEARARAEYVREAEQAAEEARLADLRAAAERKLRNHKIREKQVDEHKTAALSRGLQFIQDFEDHWDNKIAQAVAAARQAAADYCYTKEGRESMKEDAKALLMAETVEQVQQRDSDFTARFDMSDGCIHFNCTADPTVHSPDFPKGRPALDLNMDAMQLREAMYVATAHYMAKKGVLTREGLLMDKVRAWLQAREQRLKDLLTKRVSTILRRRELKAAVRARYETVIDPYSGAVFYTDCRTGKTFDDKPVLFKKDEDMHPMPDWLLRCNAETGDWYYQHRRVPWRTSMDPPVGYRMCYACGREFARRRCPGEGCEGYMYCWGCFEQYHPREDSQWDTHWATAERLAVMPLKGAALDQAKAELEYHKARAAELAQDAAQNCGAYGGYQNAYDLAAKEASIWQGQDEAGGAGGGPSLGLTIDTQAESYRDLGQQLRAQQAQAAAPAPDLGLRLNTRMPSEDGRA